jgi:hypothetical protein
MTDKDSMGRKYFDIAPPTTKTPPRTILNPEDQPAGAPAAAMTVDYQPVEDAVLGRSDGQPSDTLMEPEEANEGQENGDARPAFVITPVEHGQNDGGEIDSTDNAELPEDSKVISEAQSEVIEKVVSKPIVEHTEEKTTITDSSKHEMVAKESKSVELATSLPKAENPDFNKEPEPKPADKDVPAPAERFAVTDSLPDPGEKATQAAKEGMQDPKTYDTREYYVPIGSAHHKHSGLKMAFLFGIICAVIVVGVTVYVMFVIGN